MAAVRVSGAAENIMEGKQVCVLYHGDCPDGFGGAYAAWKKFGDGATYVPLHDRIAPPEHLVGQEVYLIDFSFPKKALLALEAQVARLVVLDHHIGAREAVEGVREHVFDNERSGAHIAWDYFHHGEPLPTLLAYIEDHDIWRHALPHTLNVTAYLSIHLPGTFDAMDMLVGAFEQRDELAKYTEIGGYYRAYFDALCAQVAARAEPVVFEGNTVLAVNGPRELRSEVGHLLATTHPPFGIIWYLHEGAWHVSLRGDGSVDCSVLAAKYGGSGHHNAAAFRVPYGKQLPFTPLSL